MAPSPNRTIYALIVRAFTFIIEQFFREINQRGSWQIPEKGPVIFVIAPHCNQFVDPLVVLKHCKRPVGFLIAQKSYDRQFIGRLAKLLGAIPVPRPQDYVRRCTGRARVSKGSIDLYGKGTRFSVELEPHDSITVGSGEKTVQYAVSSVVSDEHVKLSTPALEELIEWTEFRAMPHIDQNKVYHAVHQRLRRGECCAIFPEGGSHDRSQLLPLKAGVAIMALGALAEDPSLDLKVVPCGLNYFNAHRFRSRAVVEFGKPITVDLRLVEQFKQGGLAKREACSSLLQQIHLGLRAVTVNTTDYESLQVIQAARRLYEPPGKSLSLAQKMELTRMFADAYESARSEPMVKLIAEKVLRYNEQLRLFGIRDHQVMETKFTGFRELRLFLERILLLLASLVLSVPGILVHLPVAVVASWISKRKAEEALKQSSVKVYGRDVLATWKLLVALVATPLLYIIYFCLTVWFTVRYGSGQTVDALMNGILVVSVMPILGVIGVRLSDMFLDSARSLKPLLLSIYDRKQSHILKTMRIDLQRDVLYLIDELGPKIFPDFEARRLIPANERLEMLQQEISGMDEHSEDWLSWQSQSDSETDDVFFFKQPQHTRQQTGGTKQLQ